MQYHKNAARKCIQIRYKCPLWHEYEWDFACRGSKVTVTMTSQTHFWASLSRSHKRPPITSTFLRIYQRTATLCEQYESVQLIMLLHKCCFEEQLCSSASPSLSHSSDSAAMASGPPDVTANQEPAEVAEECSGNSLIRCLKKKSCDFSEEKELWICYNEQN